MSEATKLEKETSNWQVEVVKQIKNIEPTKFHPEKEWLATHYLITKPDGITEEVGSGDIVIGLKNIAGELLEIPAFTAHHIMSLHLKLEEAGSQIEASSLEEAFFVVAKKLPVEIPYVDGIAAFEMEMNQITGTEGVTTTAEMLSAGVVTQDDLDKLNKVKDEVFKLNISGTDDEKKAFVNKYNDNVGDVKLKLVFRTGSIAPIFTTDRQKTTKMFVVISKSKTTAVGESGNLVISMLPGRYMEKPPADDDYIGREKIEGIKEREPVAELLEMKKTGKTLTPQQESLILEQQKSQECWWNGGFVDDSK